MPYFPVQSQKADIDFFQISRRMSDANLEDFSESGTRASFLLGHDDGGCRPDLDDVRAFTRLQSLFTEHVIIFTYSRHLPIRLFALINCNPPGLGFFPWRGRRRFPPRGFGRIDHRSTAEVQNCQKLAFWRSTGGGQLCKSQGQSGSTITAILPVYSGGPTCTNVTKGRRQNHQKKKTSKNSKRRKQREKGL